MYNYISPIHFVASNVLIKMSCPFGDINALLCSCCKQGFAVKLTGLSSSKVGYNSLYAGGLDCQSFGHLVLNIFVGNYGQKFKVWSVSFFLALSSELLCVGSREHLLHK